MPLSQKEKSARYFQRHKNEILERRSIKAPVYKRAYYERNKEGLKAKAKIRSKESRRSLKEEIITVYGDRCAICGEAHVECLTIDHSKNDGGQFRKDNPELFKGSGSFYRWLKAQGFPQNLGLRVLCWNCNCSIGLYGYSPLGGQDD